MTKNEILTAMERAEAIYTDDPITLVRHIGSLSKEIPLTDDEKRQIKLYFDIRSPIYGPMEIIFDN